MWIGQFVGPLAVELVFIASLVHELALWSPFPLKGYLAQFRNRESIGPVSSDLTVSADSRGRWETSPALRSGWTVGWVEGGREGGGEGERIGINI